MTAKRTTCPYCGVGCGIAVRADGTLAGDPDHPANRGRLCSKGVTLGESLSDADRLLYPTIEGRRAGWDEALDLIAARFSRTIAAHGPDSVALYVSGQFLTEDYYVANKLMKGFIGSANIDTNSRLCMASSVAGHIRAFGEDVVPGCYEDLDLCDLAILAGSNAAWCHPVVYQRLIGAKRSRGMKLVVIDPRRTASCEDADLHLAIRPGSDVTLFNGLLAFIAEHSQIDHQWIEWHTSGFDSAAACARAEAPSLAFVAETCGVSEAGLRRFYEMFARTGRTVTLYSQGVNQSASGTDKVNAILNCHLATGRIGKPGAGPFSLTGQPNAMGGREAGGMANQLAAHMTFAREDVDRVRRFWNAPRIATKPGLKAVDLFQAVLDGKVKALWVLGTNPAASMPRADVVRAALKACPFLVVSDCWATDTTAFARVVLPAAGWSEKDGTVTNSERRISRQRAFRRSPGEARADWWMLVQVAGRMGFAEAFSYENSASIFREHAALSGFENDGRRRFDISGLGAVSDAEYESLEPVQWPVTRRGGAGDSARLFGDGRFSTPDNRAKFIAVTARPLPEATEAAFPLRLNTGRLRDQWHTMTRTGRVPRLMTHASEPALEVNPQDAATFGLPDGGLARLESRHGASVVRVCVTECQKSGEAFLPMHWTDQFSSAGPIGRLVGDCVDPISGQPDMKSTPIRVTRVKELWRGFLLTRHGAIPALGDGVHWSRVAIPTGHAYELSGLAPVSERVIAPQQVRRILDLDDESELVVYSDPGRAVFRYIGIVEDRLEACLFLAPDDASLPLRSDLAAVLSSPVSARTRWQLLAGSKPSASGDSRIVCVCFGVAAQKLRDTIRDSQLNSIDEIGSVLRAGTNCGSCIPELRNLLQEKPQAARHASQGM